MGPLNSQPLSKQTQLNSLIQEAQNYTAKFNMLEKHKSMIMRIILQKNKQMHLLSTFQNLNPHVNVSSHTHGFYELNEAQQNFLCSVQQSQLEILDSLYEHTIDNPVADQQSIFSCKQLNFCTNKQCKPLSTHFSMIDLSKNINQIQNYEQYKEIGFDLVQKRKICFVLLAGGKNLSFGLDAYKQCETIPNLPSNSSLIEILFKRLQSLGSLASSKIFLTVLYSQQEKKQKYAQIYSKLNFQYLVIDYLSQYSLGVLDEKGGLVLTKQSKVLMHPIGTADLWDFFQTGGEMRKHLMQFQYLQIFGVSNILQHCFDCFMLGTVKFENCAWATLVTKNDKIYVQNDPVIYLNDDNRVQVSYPDQQDFPIDCQLLYLNNSVISTAFIKKVVDGGKQNFLKNFRVKHKKPPETHQTSIGKVLIFEKDMTDIFKVDSVKQSIGRVIIVDRQDYYSPFMSRKDLDIAAQKRSAMFRRWLGLNNKKCVVEIDPLLSIQGQNLQDYQEFIKEKGDADHPIQLTVDSIGLFQN